MTAQWLIPTWLALVGAPLFAGGAPASVDEALIPAYRILQDNVATAGQPSTEGLSRLKAMGFKTIVNLRTAAEGALVEKRIVEGQGLRYVWIPIGRTVPREAAERLDAVVNDVGSGAILVHCASGNRAGALWAALQVIRGRPLGEAERAGVRAGMHSPLMMEAVESLARQRAGN
jgi:uncharacterized protein (TIGR01244 family)